MQFLNALFLQKSWQSCQITKQSSKYKHSSAIITKKQLRRSPYVEDISGYKYAFLHPLETAWTLVRAKTFSLSANYGFANQAFSTKWVSSASWPTSISISAFASRTQIINQFCQSCLLATKVNLINLKIIGITSNKVLLQKYIDIQHFFEYFPIFLGRKIAIHIWQSCHRATIIILNCWSFFQIFFDQNRYLGPRDENT